MSTESPLQRGLSRLGALVDRLADSAPMRRVEQWLREHDAAHQRWADEQLQSPSLPEGYSRSLGEHEHQEHDMQQEPNNDEGLKIHVGAKTEPDEVIETLVYDAEGNPEVTIAVEDGGQTYLDFKNVE